MEILIFFMLVPAIIAGAIANGKDRSFGGFFILGLFFSWLAVLIAALVVGGPGAKTPKAPRGTHTVYCPKCTAPQNVGRDQTVFECWQCKHVARTH